MFRFGNPQAFSLLWLLPVLAFIFIFAQRRARGRIQSAIGAKLTPFLMASYSPMRRRVKLGVRFVALIFFILALARPQTNKGMTAVKSEGVELIIALDVSTSMLAEDIKPSRLEYAKSELNKLLDLLGGDKVGMVAFAGSAVLLSPLTTDKSALKMYIEQASTQSVQTQGTDFRKALMEAHLAFEHGADCQSS